VTQSFDTQDSLGRLVLNILLTFAQFEREMLSDRICDKAHALRRAGHWIGGAAPYGYDLVDRRLVVNELEAAKIREI
ncbi:recombinase family protein, partial [Escherichia coli]|nr:recombinase family protein [Escherichia coli]